MPLKWNIPQVTPPPNIAASTADLKAGPGSVALAIVAPKAGPIPVTPGTPVIVVAKSFWDSPTIKKLWRAVCVAWGVFWAYIVTQVLIAGGPFKLAQAEWIALLKDASYPALLTAAAAYGIKLKKSDNDPTVK
jgi:hypothetical protein